MRGRLASRSISPEVTRLVRLMTEHASQYARGKGASSFSFTVCPCDLCKAAAKKLAKLKERDG